MCVGARCKYSNALGIAEDNYMCCSCVQEVKNGYGRRTHFKASVSSCGCGSVVGVAFHTVCVFSAYLSVFST